MNAVPEVAIRPRSATGGSPALAAREAPRRPLAGRFHGPRCDCTSGLALPSRRARVACAAMTMAFLRGCTPIAAVLAMSLGACGDSAADDDDDTSDTTSADTGTEPTTDSSGTDPTL